MAFLKCVLRGDKKLLRAGEIPAIKVAQYSELSVKAIYPEALKDPELRSYMPEIPAHQRKLPERNWFYGVMAALRGKFLEEAVSAANEKRYQRQGQAQQQELIAIKDEWLHELSKHSYFSCKFNTQVTYTEQKGRAL